MTTGLPRDFRSCGSPSPPFSRQRGGERERNGVVTIAVVARHAGLAPSTVSYALTGTRSISPGTRSRVRASIRSLGYRPLVATRKFGVGRANINGLVLPPAEELGAYAAELPITELGGRRSRSLVLLPPVLSRRASTPEVLVR